MFDILSAPLANTNIGQFVKNKNIREIIWAIVMILIAISLGTSMVLEPEEPDIIVWVLYILGAIAIFYQPRFGVYLITPLVLAGDFRLTSWYPFGKNFSSLESMMYVNDEMIYSPLETYLIFTTVSWFIHIILSRKFKLRITEITLAMVGFAVFLVFGLGWGLSRGGDTNIGLWEARPIFYLPLMYVLASHLLTKREHLFRMMSFIMLAEFIESAIGAYSFFVFDGGKLENAGFFASHVSAIHLNTLFVYAIAVWLFKSNWSRRTALLLAVPTSLVMYLAMQRRAGFLTLGIAIALMGFVLFKYHRRLFWILTPIATVAAIGYIGAFWNSHGALGLPAQAVKSVIGLAEGEDDASNIYRELENLNTYFTIQANPLFGIGFGQKFYSIVPLADISFFEWYEYITHNSIMWIWMKMGAGGFFFMIYMISTAITTGVRVVWRLGNDELNAIALTATLYIIMHFIFAYADISWGADSMLYLGTMMAMLSVIDRVLLNEAPPSDNHRWPWLKKQHAQATQVISAQHPITGD